jgi:1-acyl-sn-glycerol-3-phosphate acyltransferase
VPPPHNPALQALAQQLAELSSKELVSALGVRSASPLLERGLSLPLTALSRRLGYTLAEMDAAVAERGLPAAAHQALSRFGIALHVRGALLAKGPCLVLANHPGAYDALGLMSALGRKDLASLSADRVFLRALPRVSQHLVFVGEQAAARAGALKRALSCLRAGGAVLHFPAGQIEPDADFDSDASGWLKPWQPGVAALVQAAARYDGRMLLAGVRGVHSRRAKRHPLNRWAEQRGVTTVCPLLQMFWQLRDVVMRVHCHDAGLARQLLQTPADEQQRYLRSALVQAIGD